MGKYQDWYYELKETSFLPNSRSELELASEFPETVSEGLDFVATFVGWHASY